jgi:hypothetical protein
VASIWRKVGHALFPRLVRAESRPDRERERDSQRGRERQRERGQGAGASLPEPERAASSPWSRPEYQRNTDDWTGRNAPSGSEWEHIKALAYDAIDDGASFNKDVEMNRNALYSTGDIEIDLRAIIEALESAAVSPSEVIDILRSVRQASHEYTLQQDITRGTRLWQNRDPSLPEELYWYHWGW